VKCGKGGLPVGFMFGADALEGFEHHFPPAVVFALHAREPARKPLRGKGVAGAGHLCIAWLAASEGNMPAIGAEHYPALLHAGAHRAGSALRICASNSPSLRRHTPAPSMQ
jgi:hypothetical protein